MDKMIADAVAHLNRIYENDEEHTFSLIVKHRGDDDFRAELEIKAEDIDTAKSHAIKTIITKLKNEDEFDGDLDDFYIDDDLEGIL